MQIVFNIKFSIIIIIIIIIIITMKFFYHYEVDLYDSVKLCTSMSYSAWDYETFD